MMSTSQGVRIEQTSEGGGGGGGARTVIENR